MSNWNTIYWLKLSLSRLALCLGMVLVLSTAHTADAGTIVNFSSELGDFSVELFDDDTPVTVANFLNYVNTDRYNSVIIHRSPPNFVIQGGLIAVDRDLDIFATIFTDPNIVNEPKFSNTRGTIAMAKIGGDPNSASSQWFINVSNNSFSLDSQNGGFTVFGRVLDNGMDVVDAINTLNRTSVLFSGIGTLDDVPLINWSLGDPIGIANLVDINISVAPPAPNRFDAASGLLDIKIDAGASGLAALSFAIVATEPEAVIQALLNTVETLTNTVDKIATFDEATGQLVIPELEVDGAIAFRNLVFVLSDADQLLFTLVSFEQ